MKLPEPKKLPSGNWNIRMRLGGREISVTRSNKTECTNTARRIKSEYKDGLWTPAGSRSDLTLRRAIDQYIEAKQNQLSPATIRGYRTIQRSRFPAYMDTPIGSIRNWQAVYDSEKKRLNGKTLRNSFCLLKTVYKYHMGVAMPEISMIPVVRAERPYLDPDQISVFMEAVKGKQCEIGALLALSSLRCSEILALTWDKVDLQHSRILVAGAVVPDESHHLVSKETNKTQSSRRYVPIFIPQLLQALRKAQQDAGRVCAYQSANGLYKAINAACEGSGLPPVGIHGLRHSFASLCLHLGIPEETAMKIGGWSDYSTMRKIYTHISQKDMQEQADHLKKFFQNADENADEI